MLTILKGCASAPLAISLPADHGGQGATLSVHFQTVTRTLAVPDGATSVAFSLSREETAPLALGVWPVKICLVSAGGSRVALLDGQKIRVTDCPDEVSAGGGGIVLSDAVEEFAAEAKTAADAAVKSAAEAKASAAEADASAESAKAGLGEHLKDFGNPHQVTASQVGAYTKGETDEAIKAEADRAKAAEAAETERAKKAESANADAITAEADRAKAAEEALAESLKKVAEYMAGESILLATNLINCVQHYAKQIMRYDADMAAWGAEWEGDYTFVDGDGEVPDVYCRAYKDGVEAGYVKQTLAWDKDMNAWGAVWTASDYTPAADEAKDLYVKTTFTDGVQYYTKQTVVWDADMNDWGAVWDGTYILYRGKFMKKGK